jgi:hypothetical protein
MGNTVIQTGDENISILRTPLTMSLNIAAVSERFAADYWRLNAFFADAQGVW